MRSVPVFLQRHPCSTFFYNEASDIETPYSSRTCLSIGCRLVVRSANAIDFPSRVMSRFGSASTAARNRSCSTTNVYRFSLTVLSLFLFTDDRDTGHVDHVVRIAYCVTWWLVKRVRISHLPPTFRRKLLIETQSRPARHFHALLPYFTIRLIHECACAPTLFTTAKSLRHHQLTSCQCKRDTDIGFGFLSSSNFRDPQICNR